MCHNRIEWSSNETDSGRSQSQDKRKPPIADVR